MLGKVRNYINKNFIENNPDIIAEMRMQNRLYGRKSSIFGRGILALRLYLKYVVFQQNALKEKEKRQTKLLYPESVQNQKEVLEQIRERIKKTEKIALDIWGVLLQPALEYRQLISLAEVTEKQIGLSDRVDEKEPHSEEVLSRLAEIKLDFSVENSAITQLCKEAKSTGKTVYLIESANDAHATILQILQRYPWGKVCEKPAEGALYITNHAFGTGAIVWKNVNLFGNPYRPEMGANAVAALYDQLVNMQLHGTGRRYSLFYEYGFTCGGILTCGFCQFLEGLAKQERIDKFVFVARDGDILKRVYEKYFHKVDASYLIYSRFASFELIFEDFPEEYFDKNVRMRMYRRETDNSIAKILQECGLSFLEGCLPEAGLKATEILQDSNYETFRRFLMTHRARIQESFSETCKAAKKYILGQIENYRKVCVVDLGWNGKSIVYLKHLCEKKYGWRGEIIGAMVGASSKECVQNHIRCGLIHTYAFENEVWRGTGFENGKMMDYKECVCIEALFSSDADTLLRYGFDAQGNIKFIYGKENKNVETIREIHRGIMDFTEKFLPPVFKYGLKITARDAYTPLDAAMRNKKYRDKIYETYYEEDGAINGF